MTALLCRESSDGDSLYLQSKLKEQLFQGQKILFLRKVGIETEYQIAQTNHAPPQFKVLTGLLNFLCQQKGFAHVNSYTVGNARGHRVLFDYCYGNLEISFSPSVSLHDLRQEILTLLPVIQEYLRSQHHEMLPTGLNPYPWSRFMPLVDSTYYEMIEKFLHDFHPNEGMGRSSFCRSISSLQMHVDVAQEEYHRFFNILNLTTDLRTDLFSNSPNLKKKLDSDTCLNMRNYLWEQSAFGINKRNVVRPPIFKDLSDLLSYEMTKSIFYVKRDQDYHYFSPMELNPFFESKKILTKKLTASKQTEDSFIQPELSDLDFFRPYNPFVATRYKTIELRSVCQQPTENILPMLAFHLGILCHPLAESKLKELSEHMRGTEFTLAAIEMAQEGLRRRGLQEEKYLTSLYEKVEGSMSPSRQTVQRLQKGDSLINIYKDFMEIKNI